MTHKTKNRSKRRFSKLLIIGVATIAVTSNYPSTVLAQSNSKPLTLVVPFPPGGAVDRAYRLLAEKLPVELNRTVVVENRPGAGGRIAACYDKNARADGSIILAANGAVVIQQLIYGDKAGFDLNRDFVPVAAISRTPSAFAIPSNLPVHNLKEFIKYSEGQANPLSVGYSGNGSWGHLTSVRLEKALGIKWIAVPYKGGAPLTSDLLGGHVQAGIDGLPEYISHHRSGKLRLLAVFSPERSPLAPEVPTVAEQGYKDIASESWVGMFYPANTSNNAVNELQEAVDKVMRDPEIREKFAQMAARPKFLSSVEFAEFITHEFNVWSPVVKAANVAQD